MPIEAFPHLRALFNHNLPPFSEWGASEVIRQADEEARAHALCRPAHVFSELGAPAWSPSWPRHILLLHTQMSAEEGSLRFSFALRYPMNPPHPDRASATDQFLRDRATLYAHLVCSHAIFLTRRRQQEIIDVEAARAEAAAAEAAEYIASLTHDTYVAAWLCVDPEDIKSLDIAPEPPQIPSPVLPLPWTSWGNGTLSGIGGAWGNTTSNSTDTGSGWGPAPTPSDNAWGTGSGWALALILTPTRRPLDGMSQLCPRSSSGPSPEYSELHHARVFTSAQAQRLPSFAASTIYTTSYLGNNVAPPPPLARAERPTSEAAQWDVATELRELYAEGPLITFLLLNIQLFHLHPMARTGNAMGGRSQTRDGDYRVAREINNTATFYSQATRDYGDTKRLGEKIGYYAKVRERMATWYPGTAGRRVTTGGFFMDRLTWAEVQELLEALLPGSLPAECSCGRPAIFMCSSCADGAWACQECIVAAHAMRPCHTVKVLRSPEAFNFVADGIQKWERGGFHPRPLQELGLWVNLGHAGAQCSNAIATSVHAIAPESLVRINLKICGCQPAPTMETQVWEYLGWVKVPDFNSLFLTRDTWVRPSFALVMKKLEKKKKLQEKLRGSSQTNPWQLGEDGTLFLASGGTENEAPREPGQAQRRRHPLFEPSPPRAGPSRSIFAGPVFGGPPTSPSNAGRARGTTSIRAARDGVQGRRIIFGGPPSLIRRTSPPTRLVVPGQVIARLGVAESPPPRMPAPTVVAPALVPGAPRRGRLPRRHGYAGNDVVTVLTTEDLYIGAACPPVFVRRMLGKPLHPDVDGEEPADPKPHHKCAICCSVKSHPVSYVCGHSHCFVCVRVWLQNHSTCPECVAVIRQAPFRHYGEENSILSDYPAWVDESIVNLSWDGVRFPQN
ncbi:hypothetical protein C8F04DRAFT_1264985 [Mycena alexandri]|uniref:RING-type domain-containing protein n=1 Tax=Mycena alexandri TaxID=1745969 RepID=A0AAD6SKJ1_9AGAR|nr:hypothetical protein C8F04DRAFT_1264985 [Mycena alexandri]